jgi:hypothetical protein
VLVGGGLAQPSTARLLPLISRLPWRFGEREEKKMGARRKPVKG